MAETANISIYDQARVKLTDIGVEILVNHSGIMKIKGWYEPNKNKH